MKYFTTRCYISVENVPIEDIVIHKVVWLCRFSTEHKLNLLPKSLSSITIYELHYTTHIIFVGVSPTHTHAYINLLQLQTQTHSYNKTYPQVSSTSKNTAHLNSFQRVKRSTPDVLHRNISFSSLFDKGTHSEKLT